MKELEELEDAGIPAKKLVHVATNAHLITDFHLSEDGKDEKIGTTKRGNGPAYRDKYGRKGVRAMHDPRLQPYIIGMYHDQVLTPIKTLYEYDAINITLGLPFIRISPDHGPNEKMMGKNLSNPLSLIKAINFLDKN